MILIIFMSKLPPYNYIFECSYKETEKKYSNDADPDVDTDDVTFLCEEIYRFEFLKCFHLDEFDDDIINSHVKDLCATCSKDPRFKAILDLVSAHMKEPDLEICFMQLFSYHFLYLTQACIKQLYVCKQLGETCQQELIQAYNRFYDLG
jgi:hypothetical protein